MAIEVSLRQLKELVEWTDKRVEMAKKVLSDPSDENLIEYNYVVEVHGAMRRDLEIYPELTEEERAASALWMAQRERIYAEQEAYEDEDW